MTRLEFIEGIEFEQCYRNMVAAVRDYPAETDPSERRALIDLVELSYKRAVDLAEKYDANNLLEEHTESYRQFQELTDRIIQASIFPDENIR